MKRIFSAVLALAIIFVALPFAEITANAETSGYYTYTVSDGKATITDVDTSISGNITIPSTLGGYTVVCIGDRAFENCSKITKIEYVPYTVEIIGDYAFYKCSNLKEIVLPYRLTTIGDIAFGSCSSLVSVQFPEELVSVGEYAFNSCGSLKSVTINSKLANIGYSAFNGCNSLDIVYTDSIFSWCQISFENYAANPLYYARLLYVNKELVTDLTIPDGITAINDFAFYNFSGLYKVVIPDSVLKIGEYAFSSCTNLSQVTIGSGVSNIEVSMFNSVYFSEINISSENPQYSSENGILFNKDKSVLLLYPQAKKRIEYTIPSSVRVIHNEAFNACRYLAKVIIPSGVKEIGEYTFSSCGELESIVVNEDNSFYSSQSGILFNKDKTILVKYPESKQDTHYNIPDSVEKVCSYAFESCDCLESIRISGKVSELEYGVFNNCYNLEYIDLGGNIKAIGNYAFSDCNSIEIVYYQLTECDREKIVIESGNDAVVNAVWQYGCCETHIYDNDCDTNCNICGAIQKKYHMYNDDNDAECNTCGQIRYYEYVVENGNAIITGFDESISGEVILPSTLNGYAVVSVGESAFRSCESLTGIAIPDSVTNIGNYAFYNCNNLGYINLPNNLTTIGEKAFAYCESLKSIEIPDSVTNIGNYTFDNCNNLGYINLPNNLTTIGEHAFAYCKSLKSIEIPETVMDIGSTAFAGCELIENIIIPSGISILRDAIFYECKALKSVTIPNSLKNVEIAAFASCSLLSDVYYRGTENDKVNIDIGNYYFKEATWHYNSCIGVAEHTYSEWVLDERATSGKEGSKHKVCAVCGSVVEKAIPQIPDLSNCTGTYTLDVNTAGNVTLGGTGTVIVPEGSEVVIVAATGYTIIPGKAENGMKYTAKEGKPKNTANLSLEGQLAVNYYLQADFLTSDPGAYVLVWYNHDKNGAEAEPTADKIYLKDITEKNANGAYKLSIAVCAAQVNESIRIELYDSDDILLFEKSDYSVKAYCNAIIKSSTNTKLVTLCKSIINYGGYAQKQFNYRLDDLANADADYGDISKVTSINATRTYTYGATGITKVKTASLEALTDTSVKFGLTFKSGYSLDNYEVSISTKGSNPASNMQVKIEDEKIVVYGIESSNLDYNFIVTVKNKKDKTKMTINYCPLFYCKTVLASSTQSTNLKNFCRALYLYNQAANSYFG